MSLWKRGNVWWGYWYMDGIRHQASTGTGNRRQAELILQKLKDDANAARHRLVQVDPKLTFAALAATFIANAGPKPHHLDRLEHLLPYFGDIPICRITKPMAREYRLYRHSRKKHISDATINRDLSVLRHLLYWAVDEGLLVVNPLARLQMIRERRVGRPVLSVAEETLLLAVAPEHLRRIIVTALDTGMRRGEILNQLWEHVDFPRKLLFVTRSKTPEGEAREIPLTSRVFNLLWESRQAQGHIFTYREEAIKSIKTAWGYSLKKAGIRHLRFHDLRHSFNTRLLEAGILQEIRKVLMGHASGDQVHSRYTHIELPIKRRAIDELERWLEVRTKEQEKGGNNESQKPTREGTFQTAVPASSRLPEAVEEEERNRGRS